MTLLIGVVASFGTASAAVDGPADADEVPRLVRQLGDDDFYKREAAAKAFEALGPPALEGLDVGTESKDPELNSRAWSVLNAIELRFYGGPVLVGGRRLPDWRQKLRDPDAKERLGALTAVQAHPHTDRILPALLHGVIEDPDDAVRLEAIRILRNAGPAASPALDALKRTLRDQNKAVRVEAAQAVWMIAGRADLAIPVLTELLKEKDAALRRQVATALGEMGYQAQDAIPALTKTLPEGGPLTRVTVASALWRLDRQNDAARAYFLDLVGGEADPRLRGEALRHLGRSLPLRPEVGPILLRGLTDPGPFVQMVARDELIGLDELSPEQSKAVLDMLTSEDDQLRGMAAEVLGGRATTDPAAIRSLARLAAEDRTPANRMLALASLSRLGPAGRETLPGLLAAGKDSPIRLSLVATIARIGCDAKAVPDLVECLKTKNLRNATVQALGKLGPGAAPAVPALIEALEDHTLLVLVMEALVQIGPAAQQPLLAALDNPNAQVAQWSAEALGRLGPGAVDPLVKIVAEGEMPQRVLAARALFRIGPEAKAAIPTLLAAWKEGPAKHNYILPALCSIDPLHRDVFPALVKLITSDDKFSRIEVLRTLGALGPSGREALPALAAALKDATPRDRLLIAEAIARIDPRSPVPMPVLRDGARNETPLLRHETWRILKGLGRFSLPMLDVLPDALSDNNAGVRAEARTALMLLCPRIEEFSPEVVVALRRVLRESRAAPDPVSLLPRLAGMLGEMGPRAKPMAEILYENLSTSTLADRPAVAYALWQINRSPVAVPALVECLTHRGADTATRTRAVAALGQIGPDARAAIPALLRASPSPEQLRAHFALLKIDPGTRTWVLPFLLEALRGSQHSTVSVPALEALGEIGPAAAVAVPAVRRLTRSADEAIRAAAEAALEKISPRSN